MTSKPNYIKALHKLTRANPQIAHLEDLERELFAPGNDRATAIMFGSFVEESLRLLLLSAMRSNLNSDDKNRIFEFDGAAGSFSSRIIVAWAFNLIGPITRFDLDVIRLLRNEFAHSRMPLDFETNEVRDVCSRITIVELPGSHIPFRYLERLSQNERLKAEELENPKTRFITACHLISYRMHQKIHGPQAGDIAFPGDVLLP